MIAGVKLRYDVRCERCKRWIARTERAVRYRGRIWHHSCKIEYQQYLRSITGEVLTPVRSPYQQDRLLEIKG